MTGGRLGDSQSPPAPAPAGAGRPARLTAAQEHALAERARRGDRGARQRMTERNLGLVYAIVKPYRHCGVPFEDLLQEATIGLIRAVDGFDPRRGTKFSTYAAWWIRRSALDAIGSAQPIRVPAHAAQQLSAVRRVERELEASGVRVPSVAAVAQRTGLGDHKVRSLRAVPRVTTSLDEPTGEARRPLGETISDPAGTQPEHAVAEHELRAEAWRLLHMLPARHRQVLIRRYGVGGGRPESHREIGARLGVTEERSRQLEREALHRLRTLPRLRERVA